MTQEQKYLLLKDLCSRLPYGVKCDVGDNKPYTLSRIEINDKNGHILDFKEKKDGLNMQVYLSEVKPYLFPLDSMTEEQDKEFALLQTNPGQEGFLYAWNCVNMMKWLIENNFDYNGLIPNGLANDATGKNIY